MLYYNYQAVHIDACMVITIIKCRHWTDRLMTANLKTETTSYKHPFLVRKLVSGDRGFPGIPFQCTNSCTHFFFLSGFFIDNFDETMSFNSKLTPQRSKRWFKTDVHEDLVRILYTVTFASEFLNLIAIRIRNIIYFTLFFVIFQCYLFTHTFFPYVV